MKFLFQGIMQFTCMNTWRIMAGKELLQGANRLPVLSNRRQPRCGGTTFSRQLCPACRKLLAHAFVQRSHCPLDPKPACKKCPTHCYAPKYRAQIREVMKYSGRRLGLRGRLDYLFGLVG